MFNVCSDGMFNEKPSRPLSSSIDNLYEQPSWPDYSNWTATGFTPTVSGGELTVIGAGTFTRYMTQTAYGLTNLNKWTRTLIFRPQTTAAGGHVLLIGIRQGGGYQPRSFQAAMIVGGGALNGKLRFYRDGGQVVDSSGALTFALNDRIKYVLTRDNWTYTFTVTNLTTPSTVSLTYTVNPASAANPLHWIGYFAIYAFNGTQIIESDKCESASFNYPRVGFVGDSKTEGMCATNFSTSYPPVFWSTSLTNYNVMAKGQNLTQDILNSINEIIRQKPAYVVLEIGSNDVRSGVATATWQANYTSIRNQLSNAGIKVVHLSLKEQTTNLSVLATFMAGFSSDIYVDCFTGWNTGTMLAADGVHPNDTGMAYIASQLNTICPQIK